MVFLGCPPRTTTVKQIHDPCIVTVGSRYRVPGDAVSYISPCKDEPEVWVPTENGAWRMSILLPLQRMRKHDSKSEQG